MTTTRSAAERTRRSATRWSAALVATALVTASCSGGGPSGSTATIGEGSTNTTAGGSANGGRPSDPSDPLSSFGSTGDSVVGIRLSAGTASAVPGDPLTVADTTTLSDAEVAAVLDRLPEWDLPATDATDFNRPAETLLPPLVGDTVSAPFPPDADGPAVPPPSGPDDPLEVVRFQPEGDVDVAPFVAITFDQPMIELATLDQLDDADIAVTISPDIAETAGIDGRWRWIGTKTLRFEVTPSGDGADVAADDGNGGLDRLPAATEYTVTVPAGTASADGSVLSDDVAFTFTTPAVAVGDLSGLTESTRLDPVFVATFDQRVDPASIVDVVDLQSGDVSGARLATDAELDADTDARAVVDAALPGRAVAFVPTERLAAHEPIHITIGPDIPSLEGPLPGTDPFEMSGRTYAPLEVIESGCSDPCPPFASFDISFNNELDPEAFDPASITIEPAVPGLRVDSDGSGLSIRGATTGNTTYTVTISADLTDVHGQQLGDDVVEEFDVGDAEPFLVGPEREFVTTDPFADTPGLDYSTVNHDRLAVTAWQVTPDQYAEFTDVLESTYSDTSLDDPSWPVVLDATVDTGADQDAVAETFVDLSTAFAESGGPIVLRVEPDPAVSPTSDDFYRNRPIWTWVQQSDIAADVFVSDDELLVWVTDLLTGEPIGDAEVEAIGRGGPARTDSDGIVRIPLDSAVEGLVATSGDRTVMVPAPSFNPWNAQGRGDEGRWYVIDDRGIYRPGETVRMTGMIRRIDSDDAQLALLDGAGTVQFTTYDAQGAEIGTGTTELNALGGFNVTIEIPEGANAGAASVELALVDPPADPATGFSFSHQFQIQDFRTPEYEVTARTESDAPYYVVDPATVAVDAEYFAGGPLGDAEVDWNVSATTTTYQPPSWTDWSFGIWTPWWFEDFGLGDGYADGGYVGDGGGPCVDCGPGTFDPQYQQYVGRTDASGTHLLQIDFDDVVRPGAEADGDEPAPVDQPTAVTAEATVFDVNRQAIASRTDLIVHPSHFYVGLRSDRGFVEQGQPIVVDTTVVDVDGTPAAGRTFEVTAGRLESTIADGRYVQELVDTQTCEVTSTDTVTNDAADESMRCEFSTEVGGRYEITEIVTDDDGRSNRAVYTQWVSGGTARPTRDVEQGEVVIVPDTEFHAPGDTAELLVQAPFAPASGLMTVTRAGIESVQAFDAPDGSAVLQVPIADDDIPSLDVRVDMVGTSERAADDGTPLPDAPPQPAFAAGRIRLEIPAVTRMLTVEATPAAEQVQPGDATTVSVTVTDPAGAPVADAGVALVVVDEAVLSLTGYELADPLDTFYTPVSSRLDPQLLRESIILANPGVFGDEAAAEERTSATDAMSDPDVSLDASTSVPAAASADVAEESAGGAAPPPPGAPIDVRADFDALAVFAPDGRTDATGTVTVDVDLPDNLTRYRVMAVASAGADRFGSDESMITARLPISIRPSAPRFLNFGDRFELPLVVQNRTDAPVVVDVALETANLTLTEGAGRRVTVPADDRVEVRFPVSADEVGTARFRAASVGGEFADAAEIELPVYTPATAEAFATYGVVDGDDPVGQALLAPTGVFPQVGGLEISTSSTALQALTDAVLYLYDYRYDSADGYASRIMAVAALRDVLDAFDASGLPDPDALNAQVGVDIVALQALQNDDGGFPSWQRGGLSIPWVSVQSAHALVLAQQNGYPVEQSGLDRALEHLRSIEEFIPAEYSPAALDAISAYALYVRNLAGDADPGKALDLYRTDGGDTLQLDSLAQLWTVIDDADARAEIERTITNAAVETAGAATFATSYGEDDYVIAGSDRRSDGIILDALVSETPDSDLIPKVVTGLLGNQERGRWNNAQENSFILLALNSYFDTFESVTPDFVARAWLGDTYATEAEFRGRSTDTNMSTVPMADVIAGGDADIVVDKDGPGRLYYRLGLSYAPDDLELEPRDEGFVVERTYEAIDDPGDVRRDSDGTWDIAAGASVRVRLTMVADARRTHVALIDPLPAGLEAVNPSLATSLTVPADDPSVEYSGSWYWRWFEHQNLRDDRAEAFTSFLPGGTYEYTYVARATTPGQFVVPPTRAEEIYSPEVFGRSGSDTVVVTDR